MHLVVAEHVGKPGCSLAWGAAGGGEQDYKLKEGPLKFGLWGLHVEEDKKW
jgi:hypothetical protein